MVNPKNEDCKCFQYAVMATLNYEEIESHRERNSNIKRFINKYNWKGINYLSKRDVWKTFEKSNPTTALNVLHIKEKQIYLAYLSKQNSTREKTVNKKKMMVLSSSKKIPELIHEITSKLKVTLFTA